jgi:hypothetical protein
MNEILEKIKILASIVDDANDEILQLHIENSINAILVYLNHPNLTQEEIINNYPNAIIQLVKRQYTIEEQGLVGVTSMKQGNRSVSYSDAINLPYTIDESIKTLLPKPYVRLF